MTRIMRKSESGRWTTLRRRVGGTVLSLSLLAVCMTGCSTYKVEIRCGPKINTGGDANAPGRLLQIDVIALSESDLHRIAGAVNKTYNPDHQSASNIITADDYFKRGLDKIVAREVKKEAIASVNLPNGVTETLAVRHGWGVGKHSGVLVLADFLPSKPTGGVGSPTVVSGSSLWWPTRWTGHHRVVKVEETDIRWE